MSGFNYPSQWEQASQLYSNLGNLMGPMWQSMKSKAQYDISDAVKQAVEQAGVGGLRYSTPLGQQVAEIGAKGMAGIMPAYWQAGLGAQQAAAGGLSNLGSLYSQLPMNVAQTMMGMAGQQQGMNRAAFQPYLQQFEWGRPETYLPYALQMGQQQTYQQPQMYQPNWLTNMLNAGTAGFGLANQMGWNPFQGSQLGTTSLYGGRMPSLSSVSSYYPNYWGG